MIKIKLAAWVRQFYILSDGRLITHCNSGNSAEMTQSIADTELSACGMKRFEVDATPEESAPNESGLEIVAQYLSPTDAYVVSACLRATDIPAFVADAHLVQANYLLAIAVGGVRIRVPTARAAEAREVILAFERGDFALAEHDDTYLK